MSTLPTAATRPDQAYAGALLALVAGAVAMGASPVFVRLAAADGVGPFASAFWRVALALPVLYAWMRIEERGVARRGASFSRPTCLAGIAFAGDLFFWHLAILATSVANATFFATTAPLFVVLIVWLVLGQRIARGTWIGLALCLAGGTALIGQSLQLDPARLKGDLYGVATAFFFGLMFITLGRARETAGAARISFESTLISAGLLGLVALALEPHLWPRTWQGAAALLAMALISQAGGQGLLAVALGRLPPVFSSLVIFLEAVAAAAFGWIVLSEALTLPQALGGTLILAGIYVARPRRTG